MAFIHTSKHAGLTKVPHKDLQRFVDWMRTFHTRVEAQAQPYKKAVDKFKGAWVASFVFEGFDGGTVEVPWMGDPAKLVSEDLYIAVYGTLQSAVIQTITENLTGAGKDPRTYAASLMGVDSEIPGQPGVKPAFMSTVMAEGFAHVPSMKMDGDKVIVH